MKYLNINKLCQNETTDVFESSSAREAFVMIKSNNQTSDSLFSVYSRGEVCRMIKEQSNIVLYQR